MALLLCCKSALGLALVTEWLRPCIAILLSKSLCSENCCVAHPVDNKEFLQGFS